ncbi:carboxylate-amine ligase [Bauldia sp.]|uniref:carboxylate-amine ligase n=1 Tax=Bauldia sp. TaxID=2575872 RepID=UPI003BAB1FFA
MTTQEPSFTIGIEEEYLLVDLETRDLAADPPPELADALHDTLGSQVTSEFMRCQVETETVVCGTIAEARAELARLRSGVAACAARFGLAPIAASTHPFADWSTQRNTDKERYNEIARDLQVVARRLLISGMHVHVGIENEPLRFDIFNQLPYFLPHMLALSTSSPFWRGDNTGLHSYRLAVWNEVPRTGLPPKFASPDEFHRTVDVLINAGEIEDGTKIWWDLRPSARFPTIEMRITDMCPRLDDTVAIAALYRCVARMLYRLRRENQRWRDYSSFLVNENRWLAQRFGTTQSMIDFGKGAAIPFADLADELIALVEEDADFFGCRAEVARIRQIAIEGTSADRQIVVFDKAVTAGESHDAALRAVVDHLIEESLVGCDVEQPVTPPIAKQTEVAGKAS